MRKYDIQRDLVTNLNDGLDWYAFVVTPAEEYLCAELLRQKGIDTFVPTETRWRATNAYTKARRRRHEQYFPAVPGYVFAGFNGMPPWYMLSFVRPIRGVVGKKDKPHPTNAAQLKKFFASCSNGSLRAPTAQRHMQTREEFSVGDNVEVLSGPFREQTFAVVEIKGNTARVLAPLFGTEKEIGIPLEFLIKSA